MITNTRFYGQNILCICVDETDGRRIKGNLYHCFSEKPTAFDGAEGLLLEIDEVCDRVNYPQASTLARVFGKSKSAERPRSEVVEAMSAQDVVKKKGDKGTFIVQIEYRQHATWQGNVSWAEKGVTQSFRSALELLKLIDSALDEGPDNAE